MLRAGSRYRVGDIVHTFPHVQMRGSYNYSSKDERIHLILLRMLRDFDEITEERDLAYTICGGTLLGAIRHDGFIPWDSDAEVDLPHEQGPLLEQIYNHHPHYHLKKADYGYKILRRGTLVPAIDVFLTEFSHTDQKYQYVHTWTRELYPHYRNSYADIHPRRRYVFENITLWGPSDGNLLCQRTYGVGCLYEAVVASRGHNLVSFFQRLLKPPPPPDRHEL